MNGTTKVWYQSKTLWGSLIAMFAGIGTLAGINLDVSMQDQLAEILVGVGNVIGGALAWWGRVTAKTGISGNVVAP